MKSTARKIESELKTQLRTITRIPEPHAREEALVALRNQARANYDGGSPRQTLLKSTSRNDRDVSVFLGAVGVGLPVTIATMLLLGPVGLLLGFAAAIPGGIAGYNIGIFVKGDKAGLRAAHGSIRHARALHRFGKNLDKKIKKLKLSNKLNDRFTEAQKANPVPHLPQPKGPSPRQP